MQKLFIYGTLGPGGPNQHIMDKIGGEWEAASLKGRLVEQGWGAEMGYPGLIIDDAGSDILGHVFSSMNLVDHWSALDAFEGEGYERVLTQVQLKTGESVDAYVYVLRSD